MGNKYHFIIDTDRYSGNFERRLCAFVTGQLGECRLGEPEAKEFKEKFPVEAVEFEKIIEFYVDENYKTLRPCKMESTLGFFNSGLGKHYPEDYDLDIVKEEFIKDTLDYYNGLIEKAKLSVSEGFSQYSKKIEFYEEKIQEECNKEIQKYPAYQSVSICFKEEPSKEIIEFMKQRAKEFPGIEILGFRMLIDKQEEIIL